MSQGTLPGRNSKDVISVSQNCYLRLLTLMFCDVIVGGDRDFKMVICACNILFVWMYVCESSIGIRAFLHKIWWNVVYGGVFYFL